MLFKTEAKQLYTRQAIFDVIVNNEECFAPYCCLYYTVANHAKKMRKLCVGTQAEIFICSALVAKPIWKGLCTTWPSTCECQAQSPEVSPLNDVDKNFQTLLTYQKITCIIIWVL